LITGKSSGTRIWMCLRTEFNFFRRRSSIQTGTCRIMSWIPATWNLLRNANYLRRKVYAESVCDSLFAEMKPWNHVSLLTSYCRRLRRPQHKKNHRPAPLRWFIPYRYTDVKSRRLRWWLCRTVCAFGWSDRPAVRWLLSILLFERVYIITGLNHARDFVPVCHNPLRKR
jgi:hypothetical protein